MPETPVTDLRDAIEQVEIAYEFLISFAGEGIDRETVQSGTGQTKEYVADFEAGLADGYEAALAVADHHDEFDTPTYRSFLDDMEPEIEEARTVLQLLSEQDAVTSRMADNLNGMAVFQSVMMKFFFLDELTDHLERE
ncbi:hypothetical protein [Halobellus captivus]|uniref:hypothetical protein n=1 Tax=Halobellus captivus TaxID=2592614 RepID=UPI0011A97A77|nr:hypothetical protein [Halobellus captivus]